MDSSQINRNEKDVARRKAIDDDEKAYQRRKSDPNESLEVLVSLDVLGDGRQLSEKVICNYVLDHWWDVRFSPGKRPIYLSFLEVNELGWDIIQDKVKHPKRFEDGEFGKLYRSVASRVEDRRVCFFVHRNQSAMARGVRDKLQHSNHFFPVVFDYTAHKAYAFGVVSVREEEVRSERGENSLWGCWLGPELWKSIGEEMHWGSDVGDVETVCVVTKNWRQVRIPDL